MLRHTPIPLFAALWLAVGSPAQGDVVKPAKPDSRTARIQKLVAQLADDKRHADASRQLLRIGEPAVPVLLLAIGVESEEIEANDKTRRALSLLGRMGPDAKDAYESLASSIGDCDPKIYIQVLHTLGTLAPYSEIKLDARSFSNLIQSSMHVYQRLSANDRRYYSIKYQRFSQRIQVDADGGLDAMIREVQRNTIHRREVAAEVLGRMGPKAKKALPALERSLRRESRGSSRQNAAVLRGAMLRGRVRVARNVRVPRNQDTFTATAAEAMLKIAPGDPRSAPAWAYRLKHSPSESERARAALMIGSLGSKARRQVSALIQSLKDKSKRVRLEVITALGMIGPDARQAIPKLLQLGASEDKAVAVRAKAALKQIGKKKRKSM